jgi:hypothetical protein
MVQKQFGKPVDARVVHGSALNKKWRGDNA